MKIQVVDVTPKQAEAWLKLNTSNRPLRKTYAKALSESMKRGEFMPTHQGIAINGSRLLDGQHRLMAVIESGLPSVKMTVITDADSDTFDAIDIGARRSHSDIYREEPAVMIPLSFIARLVFARSGVTPRQIKPIYDALHEPMREIVSAASRPGRFAASAIRVGALAAILSGTEKTYVHSLYRNMAALDTEKLPLVAKAFVRQVALGITRQAGGAAQLDMLVRAFIAFQYENANLSKVQVKKVGDKIGVIRQIFKDAIGIE